MAKIWFRLIQKGLKTINDVPQNLKASVEVLLNSKDGE